MLESVSGSNENVIGSMHFLENGEVIVETAPADESNVYDLTLLAATQDFMMYALTRNDWVLEFMEKMNTKLEDKQREITKSKFTLIKGGLE